MTTSRPVQGGSPGTWGTQLDAYLDQFVDSTGNLVPAAVLAALGGSLSPLGWFNVKDLTYGAKGDGVTNDSTAIQAAINACAASTYGGVVFFPPGMYLCATGLSITTAHVSLMGSGPNSTTLKRTANVTLLSIVGSGTGAAHAHNNAVRMMTLDGDSTQTTWTSTLFQQTNLSDPIIQDVIIFGAKGIALDQLEIWDCKTQNLVIDSSGGTTGSLPAHRIRCSATDTSNNIHLLQYRNEAFSQDGALVVQASGTQLPTHIFLTDFKFEKHANVGILMSFDQVQDLQFSDGHVVVSGGTASGVAAGQDMISFSGGQSLSLGQMQYNFGSFSASDVRSLINFDGSVHSITNVSVNDVTLASGSGSAPVSDIRFAGTVNFYDEKNISWNSNFFNAPHWAGVPTSYAYTKYSPDELVSVAAGFLGWVFNPAQVPGSGSALGSNAGSASNNLQGTLVMIRAGQVVTNLYAFVTGVGSGVTSFKLGLYKKDGTFLGATADLSASLVVNTMINGAISGGPVKILATDEYYIAALNLNTVTSVSLYRGASFTGGSEIKAGSGVRTYMNVGSQSTMAANITPAAATTAFWFAFN